MQKLILTTRPEDEAPATIAAINALGFDAVNIPMMEIQKLETDFSGLEKPNGIILTSARALPFLPAEHTGLIDFDLPVYAVGDASARKAQQAGFKNVFSASGSAVELEAMLAAQNFLVGSVFWHPCGADLAAEITARGVKIIPVPVYKAAAVTAMPAPLQDLLQSGNISAAQFYSPRTAAIFAAIIAQKGQKSWLNSIKALCLSHAVVVSLQHLPWQDIRTAQHPNQGAMLELLSDLNN